MTAVFYWKKGEEMSTIAKFLSAPPENFSTQIASATVSSTALSVQLDSASGLPTEGVGQFFKKDANGNLVAGSVEFVHWTNVSGNTITFSDTDDRGITGSDSGAQSYVADDYFEVWVSGYYTGGYGGLTEHNANGTHDTAKVGMLAGAQTYTGLKTFAPTDAFNVHKGVVDLGTVGATEEVDWAVGDRQKMTLDENVTISFANAAEGQSLTLYMLQDGTGTNTITFDDTITWADDTTPTWSEAADTMNIAVIMYVGGAYYGVGNAFA